MRKSNKEMMAMLLSEMKAYELANIDTGEDSSRRRLPDPAPEAKNKCNLTIEESERASRYIPVPDDGHQDIG